MNKKNKPRIIKIKLRDEPKKYILASLLIISLVVFNFPVLPLLAEGEDSSATSTEEEGNDVVIETGDVDLLVEVENIINTNILESGEDEQGTDSGETGLGEEESQEDGTAEGIDESNNEECGCEEECEQNCQCDCQIENTNENEAILENNIEAEGESGENIIEDNSDNSLIDTGDVNLVVGLINTVNTNIIDSNFSQFLLNLFESFSGDVDLSDEIGGFPHQNCELSGECLDIVNNNQGSIKNNVLIDASTGSNLAINNGGEIVINTGDINVATNIFNFLNSNIVSSNWTQLIINVFDNWTGDLVLPGRDEMQEFFNQGPPSCIGDCGVAHITNSNEGQIENNVDVNANTGDNIAVGESSIIRTGNAYANANVYNVANSNLFGGSWFFMGINVLGNWQGNVFSLPPGFEMAEDFNGTRIYNLGLEDLDSPGDGGSFNLVNDNSGSIKNSVIVNVSTGNNSASANGDSAIINTGDANVLTNLTNVLNSNVSSSNWLFGMVNIFGSWEGDLAFGRPDLWIGGSADTASNPALPGESVTYTLTYINNGNADATGVTITDDFDENHLGITDSGGGTIIDNPGEIQWEIGNIPAGGSGSVSYSATIGSDMSYGMTSITNQSIIRNYEDDQNNEDNTDTLSVQVWGGMPPMGPSEGAIGEIIKIKKTNNKNGVAFTGSNVDYEIFLYNDSQAHLYDVVVEDVVINKDTSEIFNTYSWNLGEVFPREEITIEYTVTLGSEIPIGFYRNTAKATGRDISGNSVWSSEVYNEIEIISEENLSEEPSEEGEEVNLEDVEKKIREIEDQIKIIDEEVTRIVPPIITPASEVSPEELISDISRILFPEALAGVNGESLDGEPSAQLALFQEDLSPEKIGIEKFLSSIGGFFFSQNSRNIILGLAALLSLLIILFLLFGRKIKK